MLKLEDKIINELIDRDFKTLSDFRNATYHYHRRPDKHVQFLGGGALTWAEDLHSELARYVLDSPRDQRPRRREAAGRMGR